MRLIVERERQRMAFVSATYWDLLGKFAARGSQFEAELVSVSGRRVPAGVYWMRVSDGASNDARRVLLLK